MSAPPAARDPAATAPAADRQATLSAAAVQLIAGAGDTLARLRTVRELLLATSLHGTTELHEATLATLDAALAGSTPADAAAERVGELLERLMAAPEPTAPTPLGAAARELVPEFLTEAFDYLAQAETAFLELESEPSAPAPLNAAFRAFHSIKSSAGFIGLDALSALAHDAESLLALLRDGKASFDRASADLLLAAADAMREVLGRVEAAGLEAVSAESTAGFAELRERLREAARTDAGDPEAAAPASAPAAEVPPGPLREQAPYAAAGDAWTRVRTERLDQLVDLAGELAVAHALVAHNPAVLQDRHGALARDVQHTAKLVRQLHDLGVGLRMVPLRPLFQRAHRLVRDLAVRSDKPIELHTAGEETEIDRTMVDALWDPIVHLLRNAVDHAVEPAAERARSGKPAVASLRLSAQHVGGMVLVELQDDGRGLDRAHILRKARERGLMPTDAQLAAHEIDELIFAPGLSTASDITELSGRGVGMDVVRGNVESLGGRVEVVSTPGVGTTFALRLPLTLALTDGMVVRAGSERYIVPTFGIVTSFRPLPNQLVTEASGGEAVLLEGEALPLIRLHHVFSIGDGRTDPVRALVVIVAARQARFALLVDELAGQQQFVAKPLAAGLGSVPGIAGSAVLGDGRMGLILDPTTLLARSRQLPPWTRTSA